MSTHIEYVVDAEVSAADATALADSVVDELVSRGIILSTPQRHEYLEDGPRYATGPNAGQVADVNDCFPCGLNVEIGRNVYLSGEDGLSAIICPSCDERYSPDDVDFGKAIGGWCEYNSEQILKCNSCGMSRSIADWRFEPTWGFGNLAFAFNEWLLNEEFVAELSRLLGHRVARVHCHV